MSGFMRRLIDILEMPLTEQTASRNALFSIMAGINDPLAEHVVKLIVLNVNEETRKHWKLECKAFVSRLLQRRTKNGKFLLAKDYAVLYSEIFEPDGLESLDIFIELFSEKYPLLKMRENAPEARLAILRSFYMALCEALSKGDRVGVNLAIDGL